MHASRPRLVGIVGRMLAGAALVLAAGVAGAGATHTRHAAAQPALCRDPALERESTPVERALLAAVNAHRQERGLGPLAPSESLMRAARWKAAALAATTSGVLTEADLDDGTRSWRQRLIDCGAPPAAGVGETLGQVPGGADAAAVFQLWLEGDVNRELLETPAYELVGVAAVETDAYTFWVLDLAADPS